MFPFADCPKDRLITYSASCKSAYKWRTYGRQHVCDCEERRVCTPIGKKAVIQKKNNGLYCYETSVLFVDEEEE